MHWKYLTTAVVCALFVGAACLEARAQAGDGARLAPQAMQIAPQLRRQVVDYPGIEAAGTIVVDPANTYLYLVLGGGRAVRYGIGVGREGFAWSGTRHIGRKAEWPDWHPPAEMLVRQPYLPRVMLGGRGNPLGARALYLEGTLYRIHGTAEPKSIGRRVSSGCIRMLDEDIAELYDRVPVGTKVVVLPDPRAGAGGGGKGLGGIVTKPLPALPARVSAPYLVARTGVR